MRKVVLSILLSALVISFAAVKAEKLTAIVQLKHFPLNNMDNVLCKLPGLTIDEKISADKKASLKVKTNEPVVVNLFKTGDLDVEDSKIIYQAKIKTQDFKGKVYLEMWCNFPKLGRYFSRDLATPIKGNTDWVTEETPFFLNKGQNPDDIELNVVIQGTGTVWIDDVKLLKAPLK